MASRNTPPDRDFRTATTLPETWDEETRSIEVVFSTGARATKFDRRRGVPWIEDLPLRGMDVTELNAGAHVLRAHGLDPKTGEGLDAVIGSVVPGTARVVGDTDARARITLSRAPGKAEVVQDIRDGVIRKWSYGYRRVGRPTMSTDPETGFEVRTWAKHVPDEISAVAVPADGGTNTRARDPDAPPSPEDTTMPEETKDTRQAPEAPGPGRGRDPCGPRGGPAGRGDPAGHDPQARREGAPGRGRHPGHADGPDRDGRGRPGPDAGPGRGPGRVSPQK